MRSPRPLRATTSNVVATRLLVKHHGSSAPSDCLPGQVDVEGMGQGPDLSTIGGRLERLKQLVTDPETGEEPSWAAFDRMCGTTKNHLRRFATTNNCEAKLLVALRRATNVNLNWLVMGEQTDIFIPSTKKHAEDMIERTTRRPPAKETDASENETPQNSTHSLKNPPSGKHPTGKRKHAH